METIVQSMISELVSNHQYDKTILDSVWTFVSQSDSHKKDDSFTPRKNAHVHIIELDTKDINAYNKERDGEFDITRLNKYVTNEWLPGDVVKIQDYHGYRNDATYMWTGKQIVDLYTDIDDYGAVPKDFLVGVDGYHARYWSSKDEDDPNAKEYDEQPIDHNGMVWAKFTPTIAKQLNDSYNSLQNGEFEFKTFQYNGHKWTIMLYKLDGENYKTGQPFNDKNIGIFTNTDDYPVYDVFDTLVNGEYDDSVPFEKIEQQSKVTLSILEKLIGDKNYFLCNSINPEWLKEKPHVILKKYKVNKSE